MRFLGRRVYLGLAVVLASSCTGAFASAAARLDQALRADRRTVARWRVWWREQFPKTPLWRVEGARFMPPVPAQQLPGGLAERFVAAAHEAMTRLLVWLSPVTVRAGEPVVIELGQGA